MLQALILWVIVFFTINFFVQVARKPTELLRFARFGSEKSVHRTWKEFEAEFREHGTRVITPEFLAALAQVESSGNPYAQPAWVWRWSKDPSRIYGPPSSAVGLMQITDGNLETAGRFCIREGRVSTQDCWFNPLYARLSPADSVEMTAAFLHSQVQRMAPQKASLRQRQELAAVIHLCGPEKGLPFVRSGFDAQSLGSCGTQPVVAYVRRVMQYHREILRAAGKGAQGGRAHVS
ncbi:MAG: transglycosylase SLT domain-containing protein [Elusimicrobiota bacterium]|jgi:hypothetical protein